MAIDQLIFTPVGIVIFYSCFRTLEGQPWKIPGTLKEKFFPTLFAGFAVWPLAHIINFRFVPSHQRVLYVNCITVRCRFLPPCTTSTWLEALISTAHLCIYGRTASSPVSCSMNAQCRAV